MKPHRRRSGPPSNHEKPSPEAIPVEPVEEAPQPVSQPSQDTPNVVPPAQTEEVVYDYTQGGSQPAVYEQPQAAPIDPYANPGAEQQHTPVPVPPAHQPQPVPPAHQPQPIPPSSPEPVAPPVAPKGLSRRPATTVRRTGNPAAKTVATAGGKRPGYAGGRNPVQQPADPGFSLMNVLTMILAGILLIITLLVIIPTSLKHIKGYSATASIDPKEAKNLLDVGQQAMLNNETVSFTETEVNQYLASRLNGKQSGVFGGMMKVKGVGIDFQPNLAEVFIERSFIGVPVTISSRVKVIKVGNETKWQSVGGRIGKLNWSSEKQFEPVFKAFRRLTATGNEEISVVDSMNVKFEKDKITLSR